MSEAERSEEQSLEEILSTIRKKISADPDMSAPAHPNTDKQQPLSSAKAGRLSADINALGSSGAGLGSSGAGMSTSQGDIEPQSGAYPGGLSNVLGRIDAAEQEEDASPSAHDDDLSDLLDDPLPDPLQPVRSWNKSAEPETSDTSPSNPNPNSSWPPAGLTAGEDTAGKTAQETQGLQSTEYGSLCDNHTSSEDSSSTIDDGSLTARLKATTPFQSTSEQASSKTSTLPGDASSSGTETQDTVPRSMSALSSGFTMAPDMSSFPDKKSGSGVELKSEPAGSETQGQKHATFGSSSITPADPPASATAETSALGASTPGDPVTTFSQTSPVGGSVNLTVSASKPQPLTTQSDGPFTPTQPSATAPASAPPSPSAAATVPVGQNPETATVTSSALAGAIGSASATAQGINALSQNKTIEQMVQDMLRPMLHEWLEANLPRIVENALRIEVSQASKAVPKDAADQ